jgi:ACS family hexuronate transporter-like MFS transporter
VTAAADFPAETHRRWFILALLVASTFLNYFDRQLLSVLKPQIKAEFSLTDSHYSLLVSLFMAAYVLMYPIGGRLVDTFGSGRCMMIFVALWSTATVMTGFAGGLLHLAFGRLLLGLAEPGNYPAALRVTTVWFAPERRGCAASLFSAGSAIGAIVAAPTIAWMTQRYGWRTAFFIPGVIGGLWLFAWSVTYREPVAMLGRTPPAVPWREILRQRMLWGIVVARLVSDPVWYFLLFWFPGYIQERMHLTLGEAGAVGWIPFLVADVGGIGAAVWSDRLIRRGHVPVRARLTVLVSVACLAPLAMTLGFLPHHLTLTLAIFSVLAFVCTTWLFIVAALIADAAPPVAVATVHGISGAFGAVGGLLFNAGIGPVVEVAGYLPIFVVAGTLHLTAAAVLWRALRPAIETCVPTLE